MARDRPHSPREGLLDARCTCAEGLQARFVQTPFTRRHYLNSALVIEQGWGEHHPLSGVLPGLPKEYMMIYAPGNEGEVRVVGAIIRAAVSFMTSSHQVK